MEIWAGFGAGAADLLAVWLVVSTGCGVLDVLAALMTWLVVAGAAVLVGSPSRFGEPGAGQAERHNDNNTTHARSCVLTVSIIGGPGACATAVMHISYRLLIGYGVGMKKLGPADRMRLMRFVCSFAWADLEVQKEERSFVARLMRKLELDDDERKQVEEWLEVPPRPEDVDPGQVPAEHRKLFLRTIKQVIAADKVVDPDESENLELFEQLLR